MSKESRMPDPDFFPDPDQDLVTELYRDNRNPPTGAIAITPVATVPEADSPDPDFLPASAYPQTTPIPVISAAVAQARTAPEIYTHGHHESVVLSHARRTVKNSAAYLVPYLRPGQSLLDVGCGPGTITIDLAGRLAPGRVVGVDASDEVLAVARSRAAAATRSAVAETSGSDEPAESGATPEFVTGSAYALDFSDNTFDVVHAHQLLQHLSNPVAALREFARVARPGGLVAARDVDYSGIVWYPQLPGLDTWLRVYQAVHRGNGGEPDAGRRLKSWALAAGLGEVTITASVWCFASERDCRWWGQSWAERALKSGFATDALAAGHASQDELQQISDAWRKWSEHPEATFIMPHGEIVARA